MKMHSLRTLLSLITLPIAATSLSAMGNEDVIKLVKAGLSEETIILAIKDDKDPDFDTSAMTLISLKEAGVSEGIIQAMIGDSSSSGGATASATGSSGISSTDVDSSEVMPPEITPEVGQTYYTRINFWHEKGKSITTNYSRGVLIPVNTQVTLSKIRKGDVWLQLPDGEEVRLENVEKYTGVEGVGLAARFLAEEETKIDLWGDEVAKEIRNGVMRLGMNKDQILTARGYPPIHETPSLDGDRWVYWSSRFVKLTIVFENGVVTQGRGLY